MILEEKNIKKIYKYHEDKKSKSEIYYGWKLGSQADLVGKVVIAISASNEDQNNATSLKDYDKFFNMLTGMTAESFIKRWAPSPKELQLHWTSNFPKSKPDEYEYIMNMAYLIRDNKPFQMYDFSYEIINLEADNVDAKGDSN